MACLGLKKLDCSAGLGVAGVDNPKGQSQFGWCDKMGSATGLSKRNKSHDYACLQQLLLQTVVDR